MNCVLLLPIFADFTLPLTLPTTLSLHTKQTLIFANVAMAGSEAARVGKMRRCTKFYRGNFNNIVIMYCSEQDGE